MRHSPFTILHCTFGATRRGYVLLITILIIGAIASAILSSLLLLGTSSNQVSFAILQANQSIAQAQACAEYGLLKLRESPAYGGDEIRSLGQGTCEILAIGGIGNNNRLICTEGVAGDSVRRQEMIVSQILPETIIESWQEVSIFSLCE